MLKKQAATRAACAEEASALPVSIHKSLRTFQGDLVAPNMGKLLEGTTPLKSSVLFGLGPPFEQAGQGVSFLAVELDVIEHVFRVTLHSLACSRLQKLPTQRPPSPYL